MDFAFPDEGGDPACWAHLGERHDVATRRDGELLCVRGYEGNPLLAHRPAHEATPFTDAHFARWLALFTETVDELFDGPTAELAKRRAATMARALQRLLRGESAPGDVAIEVLQPRGGGADRRMSR